MSSEVTVVKPVLFVYQVWLVDGTIMSIPFLNNISSYVHSFTDAIVVGMPAILMIGIPTVAILALHQKQIRISPGLLEICNGRSQRTVKFADVESLDVEQRLHQSGTTGGANEIWRFNLKDGSAPVEFEVFGDREKLSTAIRNQLGEKPLRRVIKSAGTVISGTPIAPGEPLYLENTLATLNALPYVVVAIVIAITLFGSLFLLP